MIILMRGRAATSTERGRRSCSRKRRLQFWPLLPLLALALATAVLLLEVEALLSLGFAGASVIARSAAETRIGKQAAGGDFNYGKKKGSGKGFSDASGGSKKSSKIVKGTGGDAPRPITESASLAKNERAGRGQLSTTKLKDLRDKTLALRQKREAELDEYEEGRAMIAKYGPEAGVMPKKVAERSAKRGMVIGGSFYAVMLAVVGVGIFLFKTQELIIPPSLMVFVTLALLALAILGSSYGMMSASWDEDREGSLLGTEEFSRNMGIIGEGFRRVGLQQEYEKAIEDRRERKKLLEAKEEKKKALLNK